MPFVSVTRLRVRSWRYLPVFLIQFLRILRQAKDAQDAGGNLAVSVLRDADRTYWTRTVWSSEMAMRGFMRSMAHRRVMPQLGNGATRALAHWVQDQPEPPSWLEAHRRLRRQGRRSRVDHPSEGHRRFEIPQPASTKWDLDRRRPSRAAAVAQAESSPLTAPLHWGPSLIS